MANLVNKTHIGTSFLQAVRLYFQQKKLIILDDKKGTGISTVDYTSSRKVVMDHKNITKDHYGSIKL